MNKPINILTLLVLFLAGACQQKANTQINNTKSIIPENALKVNIDTCKHVDIAYNDFYLSHKGLHTIGAIDTLIIADNIYSIKTANKQIEEGEANYTLSKIDVYYNKEKVFSKDSIVTSGMFYYEKNHNLLAIPIIMTQNANDFSNETFMYILDLSTKTVVKINDILTNCSFAYISPDGNHVIFNNSDRVLLYNIKSKSKNMIIDFDNPNLRIVKILNSNNYLLDVFYSNDFANDFVFERPMRKTSIKVTTNIWKN